MPATQTAQAIPLVIVHTDYTIW